MITSHVGTNDNPADLGTKVLPGGSKRDKFVGMFLFDLVRKTYKLVSIRINTPTASLDGNDQ